MSSESSDEEYLECLREATDSSFINDSMFKEKSAEKENGEKSLKIQAKQPPSLRKSKEEDEQFNLFRVTPEFQQFVAKQLSKIIDTELENSSEKESEVTVRKRSRKGDKSNKKVTKSTVNNKGQFDEKLTKLNKKGKKVKAKEKVGVKLFKFSKSVLDVENNVEKQDLMVQHFTQPKPNLTSRTQFSEVSKEVLKQVAVDPESILSQKETLCWSNRYKAKNLFRYKSNKQGVLELVEPEFV